MILLALLIHGLTLAAGTYPIALTCNTSRGNYTAMSTYHTNLELLAAALPKNASFTSTLYAKSSVGAAPDTVYGLTHCRGDTTNTSTCSECATAAFWNAQELCTFNKDTTIFYDICIVRFADWDFSGAANHAVLWRNPRDIEEPMLPGWDPDNSESVSIIINMIKVLLQGTAKQAAYNSPMRYATGHMDASSTFPPLYSLAQCTPDLPPSECWACFQEINNQATEFFNGIRGGRVLAVPCNLRYETSKFYQGNPMWQISLPAALLWTMKLDCWRETVPRRHHGLTSRSVCGIDAGGRRARRAARRSLLLGGNEREGERDEIGRAHV